MSKTTLSLLNIPYILPLLGNMEAPWSHECELSKYCFISLLASYLCIYFLETGSGYVALVMVRHQAPEYLRLQACAILPSCPPPPLLAPCVDNSECCSSKGNMMVQPLGQWTMRDGSREQTLSDQRDH